MADNNGNNSATIILVVVVILLIVGFAFWLGLGNRGGNGDGTNIELNVPDVGNGGGNGGGVQY